ncbi:MAG: BolA/IbaG family iron-sulfur metabolism protein [Gammaproteobacteria bacterium]|nr:BolA/IbaG family iron-sulfur metabolism protein [Gammaproteobacteria bacterium]
MSVQESISKKLQEDLQPSFLQVLNESAMHNVPPGSESHFKVTVVSEQFEGKTLVARHRMVNSCLSRELNGPLHALAIHTYTRKEWDKRQAQSPDSPSCLGGSKAS